MALPCHILCQSSIISSFDSWLVEEMTIECTPWDLFLSEDEERFVSDEERCEEQVRVIIKSSSVSIVNGVMILLSY